MRVIRYHGGKHALARWIIGHLPPHTAYVEPFGGGAGVLLNKPPSEVEVYNDADGEVVNFFRVLRERPEELARAVGLTPWAREEYEISWQPTDDPLERARRFAVRSWMSIGGPSTRWRSGFRVRRSENITDEWLRLPGVLMGVAERMRRVIIEHDDYAVVIKRYDTPGTLFYCDPPYVRVVRSKWRDGAYRRDFSDDDHKALAEVLHNIAGMAVVSGYPTELYAELYEARGWKRSCARAQNDAGAATVECIWISPAAQERVSPRLF